MSGRVHAIMATIPESHPPFGSMRDLMHDLNGQLFLVRGNAELIEMTTQDAGSKEKIRKLVEACDHLADIANRMQKQIRERDL